MAQPPEIVSKALVARANRHALVVGEYRNPTGSLPFLCELYVLIQNMSLSKMLIPSAQMSCFCLLELACRALHGLGLAWPCRCATDFTEHTPRDPSRLYSSIKQTRRTLHPDMYVPLRRGTRKNAGTPPALLSHTICWRRRAVAPRPIKHHLSTYTALPFDLSP